MLSENFTIIEYTNENAKECSLLCHEVLGPGQFTRTAYRLREAYKGINDYGFCAYVDNQLAGSVLFTPIIIGTADNIFLLGPLIVKPSYSGQGLGRSLIQAGISKARQQGGKLVILIGDQDYYCKIGFKAINPNQIQFPGPVNPSRVLAYELENGYLSKCHGVVSS